MKKMNLLDLLNDPIHRSTVEEIEELIERAERYDGKDTVTNDMLTALVAQLKADTGFSYIIF